MVFGLHSCNVEESVMQHKLTNQRSRSSRLVIAGVCAVLFGFSPRFSWAQEVRRLDAGENIAVRTNQAIDVERRDSRVYTGTVVDDVRTRGGRIVIPRGSQVELFVRVARDNDLILDLESVVANGQRYAVKAEPNRLESRDDLVGSIVGAISGGQIRGRTVRVPRDAVVNFRLERPLDIGVPDRGVDRDGFHYHDYYRDHDNRDRDNRDRDNRDRDNR
jgi:hypothetical protein